MNTTNPTPAALRRRIAELERKIAERERAAETPSEKQARALGYPKPSTARDTPNGDASARAAAKLTGAGDE